LGFLLHIYSATVVRIPKGKRAARMTNVRRSFNISSKVTCAVAAACILPLFAGLTDAGAAGLGYGGGSPSPVTPVLGDGSIPLCTVLALTTNAQSVTCVLPTATVTASTVAGTFVLGDQLVLGDSSSVAPPTGFTPVTSVFVGVFDRTGLALTNGYSNALTVTIMATSIKAGDVVQENINGVWQIVSTAAVINGEATVLVTSGVPIEVTVPPVQIPTNAPGAKKPKSIHEPTLEYGSKGSAVKFLQNILDKDGATLSIDGIFGPMTEGAVKAFQSAHHLPSNGVVGQSTWRDLL
jgi:hypothetical protein